MSVECTLLLRSMKKRPEMPGDVRNSGIVTVSPHSRISQLPAAITCNKVSMACQVRTNISARDYHFF